MFGACWLLRDVTTFRAIRRGGCPTSTAAAPHVEVRVAVGQFAHQLAELRRVTRLRCPSVHSEILSVIAALGRRLRTGWNHAPGSIDGVNSSGCEQLMP